MSRIERAKTKVFLSAKSADYDAAKLVYDYLVSQGLDVFFSDASLPTLGNSDYRKVIDRALEESTHMVVVTTSRKNVESSWVEAEWGFFINEKRSNRKSGNLVTVVSGGLKPGDLPPSLRYYEVLDCNPAGFDRLKRYLLEAQPGEPGEAFQEHSAGPVVVEANELATAERAAPETTESGRAFLRGAGRVAAALRATLGPLGRKVIVGRKQGDPILTSDATSIVRELELKDPFENAGAQVIRGVVNRIDRVAHDGCTTGAILAHAIIREGINQLARGAQPAPMCRGIQAAAQVVSEEIKKLSAPLSAKTIAQAATIVANNDVFIGSIIMDALNKVGRDGVVRVEESHTMVTELDVVEGMYFDRGYLSPYFVTDAERMEVVLDDPYIYILIHEKKIGNMQGLLPLLDQIARSAKPLLIIAGEVEGEALATLVARQARDEVSAR